jgi:hypothetical protein
MSLVILFHFLCAQHVSKFEIPIINLHIIEKRKEQYILFSSEGKFVSFLREIPQKLQNFWEDFFLKFLVISFVQQSDQRRSYFSDVTLTFNAVSYLHWNWVHCDIPDRQTDGTVGVCVIGITMCQKMGQSIWLQRIIPSNTKIWIFFCRKKNSEHKSNTWRIKDLLDVTCYFISLLMCSTCFGH